MIEISLPAFDVGSKPAKDQAEADQYMVGLDALLQRYEKLDAFWEQEIAKADGDVEMVAMSQATYIAEFMEYVGERFGTDAPPGVTFNFTARQLSLFSRVNVLIYAVTSMDDEDEEDDDDDQDH